MTMQAALTVFGEKWLGTPIGEIRILGTRDRLVAIEFADKAARLDAYLQAHFGPNLSISPDIDLSYAAAALDAYFAGDDRPLATLRCAPAGTPFQKQVWRALTTIPSGVTWNYGALADAVGRPGAARAVGRANGANPVAIVVPCHRVVGANGALTGYAGGLARKQWLLDHERAMRVESADIA